MNRDDALKLAFGYADLGIPAGPVGISWDETKQGTNKRPLAEHGFRDFTTDPARLERLFELAVPARDECWAAGLHPGPAGLLVLDVDVKNGARGPEKLAALEKAHGALPRTLRTRSVSGGAYVWLRKGDRHVGNGDLVVGHVEVRSDNGFVVAPGTVTPWGAWTVDGDFTLTRIAAAPAWVFDLLGPGSNGAGARHGHWQEIDPERLHPADAAALAELRRLGGHGEFLAVENGRETIRITRPGKRSGTSASIGYVAPGAVRVFTGNWPPLEAGRTYDVDELAGLSVPGPDDPPPSGSATTWRSVDLGPVLAGKDIDEPPGLLRRSDGAGLLYAGKVHALNGEPESCKGWLALLATIEVLGAGGHVLYLDFEDSPGTIVSRLLALGADPKVILERFHYQRPDEHLEGEAVTSLEAELDTYSPILCVVDGVTEAMVLHGWDLKDNTDVARFLKAVPRRLLRCGGAILLLDHVVKDRDARGRFAIGGQHKLAGIDVSYVLDVLHPFGREREGLVRVTVSKDRPGHVRGVAAGGKVAADLALTSWFDGRVTAELRAPVAGDDESFRPTIYMERVSRFVENAAAPLSTNTIVDGVTGKKTVIRTALALLVREGFVEAVKSGQMILHRSVRPYRETTERQQTTGSQPGPNRVPTTDSETAGAGQASDAPSPTGSTKESTSDADETEVSNRVPGSRLGPNRVPDPVNAAARTGSPGPPLIGDPVPGCVDAANSNPDDEPTGSHHQRVEEMLVPPRRHTDKEVTTDGRCRRYF